MFLVLRDTLSLPTIILGNDFLLASNSQIIYHKNKPVSLCINEQDIKCCQGIPDNSYFTECLKSNLPILVTHPPTLTAPPSPKFEKVQTKPTFSIFPPGNPVSFQHFSAFVSSCRLEKNMQAHRSEGVVKDIFAAEVYNLD